MSKVKIFKHTGKVADMFGISEDRCKTLDSIIGPMVENKTLGDCIQILNDREDISVEEFCNFLYTVGYFQGSNQHPS